MARLLKTPYPGPWVDNNKRSYYRGGLAEVNKRIRDEEIALKQLLRHSAQLKGDTLTGQVVSLTCKDGTAFYVVVRESPLTLQWVPYGDRHKATPGQLKQITKKWLLQLCAARSTAKHIETVDETRESAR